VGPPGVGVFESMTVAVGVFVEPLEVWITSWATLAPDSRRTKLMAVLLVVQNAKL